MSTLILKKPFNYKQDTGKIEIPFLSEKNLNRIHKIIIVYLEQKLILYASLVPVLFFISYIPLRAQEKEKKYQESRNDNNKTIHIGKLPNSKKAALYSALLPGLGQAYNKSYWKIPIIYAGAAGIGYFIWMNNENYHYFRQGLETYSSDPNNPGTVPGFDEDNLKRHVKHYRRNRDLLIISAGFLYLLNIVDANVDANLQEFKLYKDVLGMQPAVLNVGNSDLTAGIFLKFHLN
ncbi:DUF5683 domain-containing protein [Xanthovirga aplysinae]|uniref:DUF5683 domain-containing protein n=1 Tax=Xanthovirga aplysinae TaxID=2529853 RepID=UPI0012BC46D3|nr:DUF5683 domain-containing protein [Xanthovirga aplysinae]MTI30884.1 hypothetical protein [Xanthovirga aplysinae]